jgi:hypothetical protein
LPLSKKSVATPLEVLVICHSVRRVLPLLLRYLLLVLSKKSVATPLSLQYDVVSLRFSETLVLTRAARGNIPEDAIVHSHRRENLKSDMKLCKNSIGSRTRNLPAVTFTDVLVNASYSQ